MSRRNPQQQLTSPAWDHFKRPNPSVPGGECKVECMNCGKKLKYDPTQCTTTQLLRHHKRRTCGDGAEARQQQQQQVVVVVAPAAAATNDYSDDLTPADDAEAFFNSVWACPT